MTIIALKVTLNANDELDVLDNGKTEFSPTTGLHIVAWTLSGANLKDAYFGDTVATASGFTWIDTPTGVFSEPVRSANRRRLIIENGHWGTPTEGHWVYMLRVGVPDTDGGTRWCTTSHHRESKKGGRTTNNPVIINR